MRGCEAGRAAGNHCGLGGFSVPLGSVSILLPTLLSIPPGISLAPFTSLYGVRHPGSGWRREKAMRSFHIDPLAFSFPQEMCVLRVRQSSRAEFMTDRLNRLGRLVEIASLSLSALLTCESRHLPPWPNFLRFFCSSRGRRRRGKGTSSRVRPMVSDNGQGDGRNTSWGATLTSASVWGRQEESKARTLWGTHLREPFLFMCFN